jgi:hypothetical protein
VGHEGKAPLPRLNGCYRLVEPTLAGTGGKEEHAPYPVIPLTAL